MAILWISRKELRSYSEVELFSSGDARCARVLMSRKMLSRLGQNRTLNPSCEMEMYL